MVNKHFKINYCIETFQIFLLIGQNFKEWRTCIKQ